MSQENLQAEREAFEAVYPMPSQCMWTGRGYAATGYNAWDAHSHCNRWEGWIAARRAHAVQRPSSVAVVDCIVVFPDGSVPVGTLLQMLPEALLPVGILRCDGRELSRVHFSRLFEAIGTTYGAGNGVTTFNIPDRRGGFAPALALPAKCRTCGHADHPGSSCVNIAPAAPAGDARNAALEEAARICDGEYRMRDEAGRSHPEDSASRDRCWAGSRAAWNCAQEIRAAKSREGESNG